MFKMACGAPGDSRWCSAVALRYAREHGLSRAAASQIALAVAELVSNVARHGGGRGVLILRALDEPKGIEIEVRDRGPGIVEVERALQDGWSRGALMTPDSPRDGLGSGLGAVQRAMDELSFQVPQEGGTVAIARKYLEAPAALRNRSEQ